MRNVEKAPKSFKAKDARAIRKALPDHYPISSGISAPELFPKQVQGTVMNSLLMLGF